MTKMSHARVHMVYRKLPAFPGGKHFLVLRFQLPQIVKEAGPVDRCLKARRRRCPVKESRLGIAFRNPMYSLDVRPVFLRFDAASLAAAMRQRIVIHGLKRRYATRSVTLPTRAANCAGS